jgi:hypothetical protein
VTIVAHASGEKGGIMQRTQVLHRAMPPTAVLLVRLLSATLIGVAVGDLEHAPGRALTSSPSIPGAGRHHGRVMPELFTNVRAR